MCEAGAVKVARNDEEYQSIKTEYDEDIMTTEELFQDRYGASIVDEKHNLDLDSLDRLIKDSNKALLIEFYNSDTAGCLINSIPIKEIIDTINMPISYRKIDVSNVSLLNKYDISELPSLIVIENNNIIFKYTGFTNNSEKDKLLNELKTKFKK